MIEAFRCAYKLLDEKHFSERPGSVRWMGEMIDLVFNAEAPMSLIDELEKRALEITAETQQLRQESESTSVKIDELETEAKTSKSIALQMRLMSAQPMKLIDELEPQLDALAYEGVFGK